MAHNMKAHPFGAIDVLRNAGPVIGHAQDDSISASAQFNHNFAGLRVFGLFEQLGDVNLLPAAIAAWSPDVLFAMAGLYFFTRMRT